MKCAWNELLSILPLTIRKDVDTLGRTTLQELRLRINAPPELVLSDQSHFLSCIMTEKDLNYVINAASQYSPWASATISQGFLTAAGGHRIGLCGEAVCQNGTITGIRCVHSLCIRIARDHKNIGNAADIHNDSVLILGAPGWGKTTLLRDLTRQLAETDQVCVVDERKELFPDGFQRGKHMDVLSGCPKSAGIDMMLRTMRPCCIAVDEITAPSDCHALLQAANCGVRLAATAHASDIDDFHSRGIYRPLITNKVFQTIILLHKDKSYTVERVEL